MVVNPFIYFLALRGAGVAGGPSIPLMILLMFSFFNPATPLCVYTNLMGYYTRFLKYFAVRATINLWLWKLARCSSALIHIKQNKISANWSTVWVGPFLVSSCLRFCRPFQTKHVGCNNKGCDSEPCTKKGYTPSAKNKNKQEVLTIVEK